MIIALIVAGVVVWIVLAATEESPGPEEGATVGTILDEPEEYLGETVTISGEVADASQVPGAFTIGTLDREGAIVVLPTDQVDLDRAEITESDPIQVTGTVERVTGDIEDEGEFVFEDDDPDEDEYIELFDEFEGLPAIAATDVSYDVPADEE
ncbi:MAG: hypothetical protein EDQ89_03685 [Acidobacteria bacterium]|nr:MAG: hypothetical protein EDQ89_03685 [Acidobacteriota bacterium]MCL4286366.1 hypothetical protein [Thermoleophilia bacterium]GIK76727.1 MAG: hypothetical protein BroJett022_04170 [Actinomycetes bacterium]